MDPNTTKSEISSEAEETSPQAEFPHCTKTKKTFTSFKCSCDAGVFNIYNKIEILSHINNCSRFKQKYKDVLRPIYQTLEANFLDQSISDIRPASGGSWKRSIARRSSSLT